MVFTLGEASRWPKICKRAGACGSTARPSAQGRDRRDPPERRPFGEARVIV